MLVEVIECLGVAFECVEHIGEINEKVGDIRIDFSAAAIAVRFAHLAALRLDKSQQVQRVEISRRCLECGRKASATQAPR